MQFISLSYEDHDLAHVGADLLTTGVEEAVKIALHDGLLAFVVQELCKADKLHLR